VIANIDIGGGTSKIAICQGGKVVDRTALDVGARIIVMDEERRVLRIEEAGRWFAKSAGIELREGMILSPADADAIAADMARAVLAALLGRANELGFDGLMRLEPLSWKGPIATACVSGGVSEFLSGTEERRFGDLGHELAAHLRAEFAKHDLPLQVSKERIRATVVGASQYTSQLSGSTIYLSSQDLLPLRNIPVIAPALLFEAEIDTEKMSREIGDELLRSELDAAERPVALFVRWSGSASYSRLNAFCKAAARGMAPLLARNQPLVLVGDGDVGGLIGLHFREELGLDLPVVSIDGLDLQPFDFIDIGAMLPGSSVVPVVIKSLLFPADASVGRPTSLS
jgi:ethanolamine utilization protein EutA